MITMKDDRAATKLVINDNVMTVPHKMEEWQNHDQNPGIIRGARWMESNSELYIREWHGNLSLSTARSQLRQGQEQDTNQDQDLRL